MKAQLISFETAKLAKEKWFDLDTDLSYTENGAESSYIWIKHHPNCENDYPRLTQSLLQKWLREKHKLYLTVNVCVYEEEGKYAAMLSGYDNESFIPVLLDGFTVFKTYEEALEQGLFEALKLI